MEPSPRIGIVGVGRMGANIGRRLKDVGYAVTAVYDTRPEVAKELAAARGDPHHPGPDGVLHGEAKEALRRTQAQPDDEEPPGDAGERRARPVFPPSVC